MLAHLSCPFACFWQGEMVMQGFRVYMVFPDGKRFQNSNIYPTEEAAEKVKKITESILDTTPEIKVEVQEIEK